MISMQIESGAAYYIKQQAQNLNFLILQEWG